MARWNRCDMSPDPLSASDLENRRNRSTDSASHHFLVAPPPLPDFRVLLPEQPVSAGIQPSGTSSAKSCSWPPPIPTLDLATPSYSLAGHQPSQGVPPCSPDGTRSSTWHAPDFFETAPAVTMAKRIQSSGWKSENALHSMRSRTNAMPAARRPPGHPWQSDSGPTKVDYEPIGAADPLVPPGLPSPRPELRRNGSDPDPRAHGSLSLSLALGSQPLRASDHTKAVPPIGAERSRVVSMASPNSHARNPLATQANNVYLLDTTSLEKVQAVAGHSNMSRDGLERLLRHAIQNKYAPKIISPLSPLRSATSAFDLSTDPEYQLRMPSQANNPSPRYSKSPLRRARTYVSSPLFSLTH